MRIRTILSLSHTLVIAIFILAFLAIFFTLTRPPGPPPGPPLAKRLSEVLREQKSGPLLLEEMRKYGFRDLDTLDIFDRQGTHTRVLGEETRVTPPAFLESLFQERTFLEERGPRGLHIFWMTLDIEGPHSHVGRFEVQRDRDQFWSQVRRNIAIACGIAFIAVMVISLSLSRALAEPLRKLASIVDRFGREGFGLRSEIRGTAEVEELSETFNRMAVYIENSTNELREQKEEAERTEALRRQFLSDVSHNLRTPLAAILGWNDALIEGIAEDEALYRSRIRREVLHVTKTVQRLLELSRWERAEPVLLKERVLVGELLMEVAENLQEAAENAGVTLSFEGLTPDMQIFADRQKARDVLQILLENVVEHAGSNTHAKVLLESKPDIIEMRVEDNGVGFSTNFQGDIDMERGASEVGKACLGLAIASRLVKAHGGTLHFSTQAEGGTTASFSFPRS